MMNIPQSKDCIEFESRVNEILDLCVKLKISLRGTCYGDIQVTACRSSGLTFHEEDPEIAYVFEGVLAERLKEAARDE